MKLFAKKSLGQHFLNSPGILAKIIAAAELKAGETVLEIGPGTGFLTRELLKTGARVIAIEKDQRAIVMLKQDFFKECASGDLVIIEGDILDPDIFSKANTSTQPIVSAASNLDNGQFALIANIPYYITGAILEKFLEYGPRPNRMVLLVQKEVAERIVARDAKESILSVSVKAFGIPKLVAVVPPGAFTPPPTVDSAILSITEISAERFEPSDSGVGDSGVRSKIDIQHFFKLVKAGFAHKRKFALRNIESLIGSNTTLTREKLEHAWSEVRLDPKLRAEDMSVEQWVNLVSKIK